MIKILDHSFNFLGILISILILLFVITRISWWIFRKYFPGPIFCGKIHRYLPGWFERERKVLSYFETPSVFGFLGAFLLVGIISLNVTLLAQIFELFVPPGQRIRIPYIGPYGTFPLIVGLLFALVQVALGTIRKMNKIRGEHTLPITLVIVVTIAIEGGLNFYRAWLLTSGQQPISPTLWDQVITFGGPLLAGFLGVVVPLVEILLSPYAMLEFLQPVIKDTVIAIRFFLSSVLLGLTWIYFGFHDKKPVFLPGPVSRLRSDVKEPVEETFLFKNEVDLIDQSARELDGLSSGIKQFYGKIGELRSNVVSSESRGTDSSLDDIQVQVGEFNNLVDNIVNRRQLREAIRKLRKWSRSVYMDADLERCSIRDLDTTMGKISEHHTIWQEKHRRFQSDLNRTRNRCQTLAQQIEPGSQLDSLCAEINYALKGMTIPYKVLTTAEIEELERLGAPSESEDKHEREWHRDVLAATRKELDSVSSQLPSMRNSVRKYSSDLVALETSVQTIQDLQEVEIQQLRKKLVEMDNRLTKIEEDIRDQLKDWRSEMRSKALQMWSISIFMSLVLPWRQKI
ncbi:hypothetical protein MUP77_20795 [Candidatus Bathyarchaeota archaeon]|nr:hypothetical protein [Candidatus Bathyarchaeota archaeon]